MNCGRWFQGLIDQAARGLYFGYRRCIQLTVSF